jgi:hypothetical protein
MHVNHYVYSTILRHKVVYYVKFLTLLDDLFLATHKVHMVLSKNQIRPKNIHQFLLASLGAVILLTPLSSVDTLVDRVVL